MLPDRIDELESERDSLVERNKELENKLDSALQEIQEWKETNEQNHKAYVDYYHLCEEKDRRIRELEDRLDEYVAKCPDKI